MSHKLWLKAYFQTPYLGEYFALEEKESSPYTIVSQGATVVRITNGVLQDLKMHDSLMKYQSRIPDQQEIIDHFNQQNEWNFYKKGIVNYHFTVNSWTSQTKFLNVF